MRDRVRDHRAERVQVEPVRRHGQPEPHQHPARVELLGRGRPRPGDPADGRSAARSAEIEAAQQRSDRCRLTQTVVAEEQPDERPGEAQAGRREPVAGALSARSEKCVHGRDLCATVVFAQVLEERVGVERHDPVDQRRVRGEARLVAELTGDRGELVEHLLGRCTAVVAPTGSATQVQELDGWCLLVASRLEAHASREARLGRVHSELRIERLVPEGQASRGCGDVESLEEDADARCEEAPLGILDGEQPLHRHFEIGLVLRARPHAPGLRVVWGRREARVLDELCPDRSHPSGNRQGERSP